MLGEKEKLLWIWRREKPRAVKGAGMSKLPVLFKAQNIMGDGNIFCSWMKDLENRMEIAGRKVRMLIDNTSLYKGVGSLVLKTVKVVDFPCNTISCTQPLDA